MNNSHPIIPNSMDEKALYETPTVTQMSDEEVLGLFQMTASQIGAAAVWWSASCSAC
jgi:hypothetical protein